jgi:hypothetical protein
MDKPEPVPDFGEPWEIAERRINGDMVEVIETINGDCIVYGLKPPVARKIVACVNALAGCRPEKLAELIETIEAMFWGCGPDDNGKTAIILALREFNPKCGLSSPAADALAAFTGSAK